MTAIWNDLSHHHDWRIAPIAVLVCAFSFGIALMLLDRAGRLSPRARAVPICCPPPW